MNTVKRLWPYYRPRWYLVLLSLVMIGLAVSLGVAAPLIIGWVVDQVILKQEWHLLLPGSAAVVLAAMLQGFLRFGQRYTMELVSQKVILDLRSRLYEHLHKLSFGFFDKAQTGELMSRVTADVEALRQALGMGVVNGLMHFGTVTGIIIAMFIKDWRLAAVSLLFLPFLLHAIGQFSKQVRPNWLKIQEQQATLSSTIQENIAGVRVVRAFAREEEEIAKFQQENATFQERNVTAIRLMAFWTNYMNFLTAVGMVTVLWYGGHRALDGAISIGTLVTFNAYLLNLNNPVRMLGWIVSMFTRAGAASQRIFELLDTKSEVVEKEDAIQLGRLTGKVTLENVSFQYDTEQGEKVLDAISLEVQPGERIAILGLTGSGKSSLVNLIPRFYDPTEGRVLVDGIDLRDATIESLRRNVGIVLQETFLFSTSLKENIAYGNPTATMDEIMEAAKAAQIHDFIMTLPQQYETEVGERGVGLSGGQKQRMAIARALLMDTPILILDESTSAVDVQTEHLIQNAMDRVMQGRTCFVIASRLSTVMNADRVVVLEEGRVAQMGTHDELLQQEGLYRQIYDLQLKPAEELKAAKEALV